MKITAELRARALRFLPLLRRMHPHAGCELIHDGVLQLAIAAILSAQCTDKRVNLVTPALFKKYRTAADWAATPQAVLEGEIRSTGFFRNKAKNIRALAQTLVDRFAARFPSDLDALVTLPGIGRKTANLILATGFRRPGLVVDTHCKRVSARLGFTESANPDKIEFDLKALLPEQHWTEWSHLMVFHGRYLCHARKPECPRCLLAPECPSAGKA